MDVKNGKIALVRVGSTSGNRQSINVQFLIVICAKNNLCKENPITGHRKLIVIFLALQYICVSDFCTWAQLCTFVFKADFLSDTYTAVNLIGKTQLGAGIWPLRKGQKWQLLLDLQGWRSWCQLSHPVSHLKHFAGCAGCVHLPECEYLHPHLSAEQRQTLLQNAMYWQRNLAKGIQKITSLFWRALPKF